MPSRSANKNVDTSNGNTGIGCAQSIGKNDMKTLPDYLPEESKLVIVGCNPSLVAARMGFYYSGRGNQFWALLHESGLVPERLRPIDTLRVTEFGIGLTDLVKRPTRGSGDISTREFGEGRSVLHQK